MSGHLDVEATDDEFLEEVLELCIGCKGCATDCPSEVDLAKLKAELTHQRHDRHGSTLRDRLFANAERTASLGSRLAPVSNWLALLPGVRAVMERTLGIARDRALPTFARESFVEWFETREPGVSESDAVARALIVPDTFTNYTEPAVATAAVRVLEATDVHVRLADVGPVGRSAYSTGFLDLAESRARAVVAELAPRVQAGWDVVLLEPSAAVMLQSDYVDLLGEAADVELIAEYTFGLCEYLDVRRLDDTVAFEPPADADGLTYHGHCHQTAIRRDHHAVAVLRRAGYAVEPLDSTCCGMAGSFGYEAEHYSMSRAIGDLLFDQLDAAGGRPVAPGASCRTQLADRADATPPAHPVELLAAALPE
jgi:Fe-S oxidoreductase